MRYSKDHKAETHARIVQNASVQLREKGARGVGVADLMKDVGLTHGGFYAHFDSRDHLVNEAIASALDQNAVQWGELMGDKPFEQRLKALADIYLSAGHRDHPGKGCTFAALGADASREGPKTRRVFHNKLDGMVNLLGGGNGKPPSTKTRQQAISAIATLVGTLVLARAAGNGAFSDEILQAGKSAARERSDTVITKRKSAPHARAPKRGAR
jgi:TetR/AcrR family transcriptional regulator, transcriptional repressor for nem operon